MTQYPATRAKPASSSAGIDLKTLLITAVSSAAAAYATSKIWAPGTLAAAAFTPVMVAVIREGLAKSTEVVTKVVPVKGVVRSAAPEGPQPLHPAASSGGWSAADLTAASPAAASTAAGPPSDGLPADGPALRVAQPGEISYHGTTNRGRNWRIAIITGLLGFLIAAVVFTVPELVSGSSASGGGRSTTLFGGSKHATTPAETTTTKTTTTPVKTVTTPPSDTVTVPPRTVTTPPPTTTTPEVDPGQATPPDPAATTTVPPPVAEPPPAEVPPG